MRLRWDKLKGAFVDDDKTSAPLSESTTGSVEGTSAPRLRVWQQEFPKKCRVCGKDFIAHNPNASVCSPECRKKRKVQTNKELFQRKRDMEVSKLSIEGVQQAYLKKTNCTMDILRYIATNPDSCIGVTATKISTGAVAYRRGSVASAVNTMAKLVDRGIIVRRENSRYGWNWSLNLLHPKLPKEIVRLAEEHKPGMAKEQIAQVEGAIEDRPEVTALEIPEEKPEQVEQVEESIPEEVTVPAQAIPIQAKIDPSTNSLNLTLTINLNLK